MKPRAILIAATALTCLSGTPLPSDAAEGPVPGQVAQAIADRRSRVAEFGLIKQAAEELGVRVWLFGGTAAAYAHYVRWDLAREAGDPRYRGSFFDYDFTNIYRSTQDADLVVDGTAEQAEALENLIKQKMSFLQGSKESWEVRLLRQDRLAPGGQVKQALLNNPDFLGQNTDSNSTGMIELTDPPPGETVVRDLRDWTAREPFFLTDVAAGRLHYYRSESHRTTTRFLEGHNPPLFSVIRYLVKAFQYGLTVDGEDLKTVKAIVNAFDPKQDPNRMSDWARGWLERYGPNLIRHAVDVEYAWNTLERLGLRQKLIALSDPLEGKLGWWLSREPLRSSPLGIGPGRTAGELGITTVAHETSDFLAYESMTRDMTGRPNVLISRPGQSGEAAQYGPGFYTRLGREGARGTGMTIRFQVDPAAREGRDFTVHGEFVLFTNRAALRVVPESLELSLPDYLEMLSQGRLDPADRGVWMKLQRRLRIRPLSPEDEARAVEIALRTAETAPPSAAAFLFTWLSHPIAGKHPQVLDRFAAAVEREIQKPSINGTLSPLVMAWFSDPVHRRYPALERQLLERVTEAVQQLLPTTRPGSAPRFSPAAPLANGVLGNWFSLPISADHPELVRTLLRELDPRWTLNTVLAVRPEWAQHPDLLRQAMETAELDVGSVLWILGLPAWTGQPELLHDYLGLRSSVRLNLAALLAEDTGGELRRPEVVREVIARSSWDSFQVDDLPQVQGDPDRILEEWGARESPTFTLLAKALGKPRWTEHPELVQALLEALPPAFDGFSFMNMAHKIRELLNAPQWAGHPELILAWLKRTTPDWDAVIDMALREEPWREDPTLLGLCQGEGVGARCLRASLDHGTAAAAVPLAEKVVRSVGALGEGEEGCR